jgi:sterol desaturase/sphingolipid hydroxylase (fatty acid hydroxylase superfamily)
LQWLKQLTQLLNDAHLPHVPQSFWQDLPMVVPILVSIVTHDFADYWSHRAMHTKWLWPIHAIHHSDPEVTAFNTLRIHAFEGVFMAFSYVVSLTWLGLPPVTVAFVHVGTLLFNQYIHVNIDWGHGALRYVLASPRFHRWHHVDHPHAHGKNLANLFPLFDLIFGTYRVPGPCVGTMGAEGVPRNDVVELVLFPLKAWSQMLRAWALHRTNAD